MKVVSFAIDFVSYALKGDRRYYTWLGILGLLIIPWFYGAYQQFIAKGMIVLGLTDQISWGPYMGNVAFLVGVAAAAVTVVFPYYVYRYKPLMNVVLIGEMMAITAVTMVLLFVIFHMGRPDRLWHIIPIIGIFNFPHSMLNWDVIVLNGYLLLNLITGFYYMYKKYTGEAVNERFYMPFIYVSVVWALSIHTVTAFLISTMPTRPMWFHSMMPIKFIATAFAAGSAIIVFSLLMVRKFTKLEIPDKAVNFMSQVTTWCLGITIFLIMSELVTELYPSTEHSYQLKYVIHGLAGLTMLVPWMWASWLMMIVSFVLLLIPGVRKNHNILLYICLAVFLGIWVDKGIGLIIPGGVVSPIGELSEFHPTWFDIINNVGNWAIGLFIFTFLTKGAVGVMLGEVRHPTAVGKGVEHH